MQTHLCLPRFSEEFPWIFRTVFRRVLFRRVIRSDFCGKGYRRSVNGSICSTNTALPAEYSSVRQINLVNVMATLLHLTSEQWFHEIAEDIQFKYMCCLLGGPPLLAKLRNLGDKENIPFWLYCYTRKAGKYFIRGHESREIQSRGWGLLSPCRHRRRR